MSTPPHAFGPLAEAISARCDRLAADRVADRLWARDHRLWKEDPTEISNRLGWLDSPSVMADQLDAIVQLRHQAREEGMTHALLLGMGGSSLAPEVFRLTFGVAADGLDLAVLDSTHPEAVLAYAEHLDPASTLYLPATKSGGTVETLSFLKYFYKRTAEAVGPAQAGRHFAAITDPGSGLADLAAQLDFRQTFLNDPDIGGRYSALSFFGLVAAGLVGIDLKRLLESATDAATACAQARNPGLELGAFMGEGALAGRDKLTLVPSPQIAALGAWVEQLVAESSGKEGKGILPVDGESLGSPSAYGPDRLFVDMRLGHDQTHHAALEALAAAGHPVFRLQLDDLYDLSGVFFQWEVATAVAGQILGINPFDQPNVESAKILARKMVAAYEEEGRLPALDPDVEAEGLAVYGHPPAASLDEALETLLAPGEAPYLAIQAYLPATPQTEHALQRLRLALRDRLQWATTLGYGPRFLHSTGQLHKGDGGNGRFLQLTDRPRTDADIPDEANSSDAALSFGVLIQAQAQGDRQALLDAGRRVLRLDLGADVAAGLDRLIERLQK